MFKPLVGIFGQDKLIPLRYYCPIQIKLGMINNGADAVFVDMIIASGKYKANWGISDIQCKCELLTLDSNLDNEDASHRLPGKPLPINYGTLNGTSQSTGSDHNFSTHTNRYLTRLKTVFITVSQAEAACHKEVNDFYHPVSASVGDGYFVEDELQVWLPIGSKLVPEYPMTSVTEALCQIKKAAGTPFQVYSKLYRTHKNIIGLG